MYNYCLPSAQLKSLISRKTATNSLLFNVFTYKCVAHQESLLMPFLICTISKKKYLTSACFPIFSSSFAVVNKAKKWQFHSQKENWIPNRTPSRWRTGTPWVGRTPERVRAETEAGVPETVAMAGRPPSWIQTVKIPPPIRPCLRKWGNWCRLKSSCWMTQSLSSKSR